MPVDPRRAQLLSALHFGQKLWLAAGGMSMWPLLLPNDRLMAVRCPEDELVLGDIAVVRYGDTLIAHVVTSVRPLETCSLVGTVDPPGGQPLARIEAMKRGGRRLDLPQLSRTVLPWFPRLAPLLKRVPFARTVVRLLRERETPPSQ